MTTGLATRDEHPLDGAYREAALELVYDVAGLRQRMKLLDDLLRQVMVRDVDYGVIPGTKKPSLFKPGAEKLLEIYGLGIGEPVIRRIEDWDAGFWQYEVQLPIVHRRSGEVIGWGTGSCNSKEARYRWRNDTSWHNSRPCTHTACNAESKRGAVVCPDGWLLKTTRNGKTLWERRTENDSRWDLPNTLLKMAKKRALVDGALTVTRSSDRFTQDVEDFARSSAAMVEEAAGSDDLEESSVDHQPRPNPNAPKRANGRQTAPLQDLYAHAKSVLARAPGDSAAKLFLAVADAINVAEDMPTLAGLSEQIITEQGSLSAPRVAYLKDLGRKQQALIKAGKFNHQEPADAPINPAPSDLAPKPDDDPLAAPPAVVSDEDLPW